MSILAGLCWLVVGSVGGDLGELAALLYIVTRRAPRA